LSKPAFCPDEVYQLMMDCWNANPAARPEFSVILSRLEFIAKDYTLDVEKSKVASRMSKHVTEKTESVYN
jgi:hypothetical protein